MSGRDAGPSEWSSRALTRRLADYLVNAYTDGRGYDPTDLDDVEVTLRDGFDIVLGEMREAQRDRSDGGGSEDSTTASECPATAEPPSAPVTASGEGAGGGVVKALTIRQPWASLIAAGVKTIETRSWSTKYRGPIAIHAGKHPVETNTVGYWWEGNYPLGAVVATCTLADVIPMIELADEPPGSGGFVYVDPDFIQVHADTDDSAPRYLEAERHLGIYGSGRYAWLLTDVTPTTVRCPVCQDNATGRERAWHQTHSGGICDAAHGSCFTPWCRCRCHVEARCPVCRGVGRCDPIPAKGRQGLWDWEGS